MDKEGIESNSSGRLEDDVDALFKLPLAEFTGARNDLAARLKRGGRADDASLVKALAKPSVSAWAVNQLYWKHRDAFDRLLLAGQRFRQAQTSSTTARVAEMRESLDARREALSHLSEMAAVLLRDADHNPTADTLHRITTTLEAVSAYAATPDGPTPGRLNQDLDPPGFGSLGSFIPSTDTKAPNDEPARVTPSQKPASADKKAQRSASPERDVQKLRQLEETRRAGIAAAKASLQEARRSLTKARSRAQSLEAAQKKALAEVKEADAQARHAEKQLSEAEKRFKKASADSQDAAHRAQRFASEAQEASQAVEDATRSIKDAENQLEALLQESTAR